MRTVRWVVAAAVLGAAFVAGPAATPDQGRSGDDTDWGCGGHAANLVLRVKFDSMPSKDTRFPHDLWRHWWLLNRRLILDVSYRAAPPEGRPPAVEKWRDDARDALRKALENSTSALVEEAALALGRAGDVRDTEVLVKIAGEVRRTWKERARAVLALGLLPVEKDAVAAARVREALFNVAKEAVGNDDDRIELWSNALYAVGLRADPATVPELAAFVRKHRDLVDTEHDRAVHREVVASAVGAMGLFRDSILLPELLTTLRDEGGGGSIKRRRAIYAEFAAFGLARVGDKAALPALREAVRDERREVSRGALLALGALVTPDDAASVDLLLSVVSNEKDDLTRAMAALSLGRSGAAKAPAALRAAYADASTAERPYFALALGLHSRKKPDADIQAFLLAELGKKHNSVDTGALALANGLAGSMTAAPRLAEIARDEGEHEMRAYAAYALGLLGREGAVPDVLLDLVVHGDPLVRHGAALALGLTRRRDGVDALIQIVEKGKAIVDRRSACVALGRIGGPESAAPLIKVLLDEHEPDVLRVCAAHGLGLLLDRDEGLRLAAVGADVNWISDKISLLPTDCLFEFVQLLD